MTTRISALCLGSLLLVAAGSRAQQPPGRASRVPGQAPGTIRMTGCLDRANDGTYQLRNASVSPGGTRPSAGTPGRDQSTAAGTSGVEKTAAAATGNTWILKSTTDLAPHVGHSVEVTGRTSAPSGASGSDTATTSPPTTTVTGARMSKPGEDSHSVDVQSVRMISRACS